MKDQDSIIVVLIFSLVLLHFELLFLFQLVAHIGLVFIVPKHLVCVSNAECICQDWILLVISGLINLTTMTKAQVISRIV